MRKFYREAMAAVLALAMVHATLPASASVTAQDYVQDGLIAHWDGIENVGYGQYDAHATVWKNLVSGGLDLTLTNGAQWVLGALQGNGKLVASTTATIDYQTIEIVFANEKTGANAWLFSNGVSKYIVLATGRVQWINSRAIKTFSFSETGRHALSWVNDKAAYVDCAATTYGDYNDTWGAGNSGIHLGARNKDNAYGFTGKYFSIRIYNRELTAAEVAANHAVDAARFTPGTYTWAGTAASDWSDAANWTVDGGTAVRAPQADDAVVIPAGTTATVTSDLYGFASLAVEGTLSRQRRPARGGFSHWRVPRDLPRAGGGRLVRVRHHHGERRQDLA